MSANTRQEAQACIDELYRSAWALSALAVALERGVIAALAAPAPAAELATRLGLSAELVSGVLDVLVAVGLVTTDGARYAATSGLGELAQSQFLLADLRSTLGSNRQLIAAAQNHSEAIGGWRTSDPIAVEAQGKVSTFVTRRLITELFPSLEGLDARLRADGAAALDVGAGAAGIPITLCQHYPRLRVVAIEPATSAMAIARRLVAQAELSDRIELREHTGEATTDRAAYDFVYIAQMFFPEAAVDSAFRAAVRALKPGGYLVTGAACCPGAGLVEAVSRLRSVAWSGAVRIAPEVMSRLSAAGLSEVRPGPAYGALQWIVGRRSE